MSLPIGLIVVPFWGSYLEFDEVIPKRNYYGAYGKTPSGAAAGLQRSYYFWVYLEASGDLISRL